MGRVVYELARKVAPNRSVTLTQIPPEKLNNHSPGEAWIPLADPLSVSRMVPILKISVS